MQPVWYFAIGEQNRGPATVEEIRDLVGQGLVDSETLIWRPGWVDWAPLGETALSSLLKQPPPLPTSKVRLPSIAPPAPPAQQSEISDHAPSISGITVEGEKQQEWLAPPQFWLRSPRQQPQMILEADLEAFILKTEFVHRSINMFVWAMAKPHALTQDALQSWLEIFARPTPYPPLDSHPLSPNYKAPQNPPRSSRA